MVVLFLLFLAGVIEMQTVRFRGHSVNETF